MMEVQAEMNSQPKIAGYVARSRVCASGENVSEVRVTETGFKGRVHLREEDYQPSLS